MIAIVDYGMGNLRSVQNAFRVLNEDPQLITDPGALADAEAIVLPGVGAFGEAMMRLNAAGFVQALEQEIRRDGKPFLGLCLGMQLMATESFEHGRHRGLGWIEGTVREIPSQIGGESVRVPHMGWNDLEVVHRDGMLRDVSSAPTVYYVHSYFVAPTDTSVVSGYATHGVRFASVVEQGNLFGTQFHPEKSQQDGLALLRGFLATARASC
jgi:imidazole glycerol-phosphate synthase subunit HisH